MQDELYAPPTARGETDDARMLDLEVEPEAPFLRAQKRVSARRGTLPKKTTVKILWGVAAALTICLCGFAAAALYRYGEHSWRFRIETSDNIEVTGLENVNRSQVMEVMGSDIGHNLFFVPLAQRKVQLEQIPWVESASVMRFVPNRLRVEIHERTPVAFTRVGSRVLLVDAGGALMELPGAGKKKYSFPVVVGMNSGEPLSTRAARMKIYNDLVGQLDSTGAHYSQDISEVDLSDPDDVKVLANNSEGDVLVHLGSGNYLDRYKIYVGHVQEWRRQFTKLESVDLRYDRQIIVNPDLQGTGKAQVLSAAAAKATMAEAVKRAALTRPVFTAPKPPTPTPAAVKNVKPQIKQVQAKPQAAKPVVKKRLARSKYRKPAAKIVKAKMKTTPVAGPLRNPAAKPAAAQNAKPKTNAGNFSKPALIAAGKGKKPSPAIMKNQENP